MKKSIYVLALSCAILNLDSLEAMELQQNSVQLQKSSKMQPVSHDGSDEAEKKSLRTDSSSEDSDMEEINSESSDTESENVSFTEAEEDEMKNLTPELRSKLLRLRMKKKKHSHSRERAGKKTQQEMSGGTVTGNPIMRRFSEWNQRFGIRKKTAGALRFVGAGLQVMAVEGYAENVKEVRPNCNNLGEALGRAAYPHIIGFAGRTCHRVANMLDREGQHDSILGMIGTGASVVTGFAEGTHALAVLGASSSEQSLVGTVITAYNATATLQQSFTNLRDSITTPPQLEMGTSSQPMSGAGMPVSRKQ